MIRKISLLAFAFVISFIATAQDSLAVEEAANATGLRAEGKIYVVMLVSVTILIGLLVYLIRLDRKISRLEKTK